ncbi:hypothetical protein GDO81_024691 [Engystomops pustulosus]|uniref:Uncharacterized protein n=1 Tax=Engystomops pustulosus TaxID=76066 RepID=A0AAV6YU89_ENGPU|nr:hypothetical protein GDO81_024691 [Engystomops pustulosus]
MIFCPIPFTKPYEQLVVVGTTYSDIQTPILLQSSKLINVHLCYMININDCWETLKHNGNTMETHWKHNEHWEITSIGEWYNIKHPRLCNNADSKYKLNPELNGLVFSIPEE